MAVEPVAVKPATVRHPAVKPMAAKQARGRETVERLLSAALDLYERNGPEGYTMTGVINASGVSVGSLYHHFGSFNGLTAALYARLSGELLDRLVAAVEPRRTARTGVQACVTAYLDWCTEHRAKAHFLLGMPYQAHLVGPTEAMLAETAPQLAAILAWIAPHVEAGRIVDVPDSLLGCLLIGPVTEAVTRWLVGMPGADDITEAFAYLPDRIWASVKGPNGLRDQPSRSSASTSGLKSGSERASSSASRSAASWVGAASARSVRPAAVTSV
ncbi:TetR family transcriptional regulator [Glycomyces artemisiae]|uniref:TetR family transcriptional regulator n=1 Tax=Glycomyces artemisiae TaxID=1076443 RepID=A0A2T0UF41_9ACTN|nr:TetR family transcriptional regulator [Glycomyces artemisiae]